MAPQLERKAWSVPASLYCGTMPLYFDEIREVRRYGFTNSSRFSTAYRRRTDDGAGRGRTSQLKCRAGGSSKTAATTQR